MSFMQLKDQYFDAVNTVSLNANDVGVLLMKDINNGDDSPSLFNAWRGVAILASEADMTAWQLVGLTDMLYLISQLESEKDIFIAQKHMQVVRNRCIEYAQNQLATYSNVNLAKEDPRYAMVITDYINALKAGIELYNMTK